VGSAQSLVAPVVGGTASSRWSESEFRDLFFEHYPRIVGVLMRVLGERSRAEEIANDTLWRLYCQPALPPNGNVGGWLYRTATNLGIDVLRASARRSEYENQAARAAQQTHAEGPLDEVLREERCRKVRAVLAELKPAQAQLLILRSSGFSYKEIADALIINSNGIGTLLNRAEAAFRQRYIQMHGTEGEL
jgi:RNA polymerase sigma-70 factor (ECF subfamily)